jgi:outer membrane protein OmpA-like peptidoglycan-associated protein/tetratricopeptide (TPR) repeat protein
MKRKLNYIGIILVLLLTAVVPVTSQTLKTADLYFSGGAYHSASKMYRDLLKNTKNSEIKTRRGEILFRIGECYRKMNKTDEAKSWYVQAKGAEYDEAELHYGLGSILLLEGKYAEAKLSFQQARDRDLGDRRLEAKLESCDLHELYARVNDRHKVSVVENLKTRGSEYGLSFYLEKLIFASTGIVTARKEISERTGLPYSDLYMASPDARSLYGKVAKLESSSGSKSKVKTRANEGTFCYDVQTNQLYCTRCEVNNIDCYIVKIDIQEDGTYKENGKLKLGNKTYGIGHPYITEDGKRIYFTSTMPGGYGGADLWYVDRNSAGEYSEPVNLGEDVNTAGDEVFPSFIDGVLYFASDGHPGLGGLDLFVSYLENDDTFGKPFNMRAPFNSSWDDFNLVHRHDNKNVGLFVSNRNNSESSDDIYMFDNFPPQLIIFTGYVYDNETKEPLKNYTVIINDADKNKIYEQTVTDEKGYFLYLGAGKNYDVQISSPGYLLNRQTLSTEDEKNFAELSKDTYLSKENVKLTTSDSAALLMIIMKDIFYEFDKFRLTEQSKRELDKYILYFNQYPAMEVEINSHTDSRGTDNYNQKLSEKRAESVVNYFVAKGINPNRLSWRGFGKTQLLIPDAQLEAEHQANRRTVFKILKLGVAAEGNVEIKHITALEMLNGPQGAVDMSGWWLQVIESTSSRELELPVVKVAERISGKEVRLIRCDDGKFRYCIQYMTRDEALKVQLSLLKENIHTILMRF